MPHPPKILARRSSATFPLRACDDETAVDLLILMLNEEAQLGVTGAACVVRERR